MLPWQSIQNTQKSLKSIQEDMIQISDPESNGDMYNRTPRNMEDLKIYDLINGQRLIRPSGVSTDGLEKELFALLEDRGKDYVLNISEIRENHVDVSCVIDPRTSKREMFEICASIFNQSFGGTTEIIATIYRDDRFSYEYMLKSFSSLASNLPDRNMMKVLIRDSIKPEYDTYLEIQLSHGDKVIIMDGATGINRNYLVGVADTAEHNPFSP